LGIFLNSKSLRRLLFSFCILISAISISSGQTKDSLNVRGDTLKQKTDTSYTKHRANRAALLSTILPGAGQFYNKKYWKIPILYAGFVGIALSIDFNNTNYQKFRKAYLYVWMETQRPLMITRKFIRKPMLC
jgi:hypothetical protein